MEPLKVTDRYATQELRDIVDKINKLLEIKPGKIKPGQTQKITGGTYECVRMSKDVIVVRYYGGNVYLTSELATMVELTGYPKPQVVNSGVMSFSACIPKRG